MISIVDYGLGNVRAFQNMYRRMNIDAVAVRTAEELRSAERIVLPGVGAFDHAMDLLDASGMRETLDEIVLEKGVPVVGVCVGMQILAESSEEGTRAGLGWIKGTVRHFRSASSTQRLMLPHMGWNDVEPKPGQSLFKGFGEETRFYFLHSFYFDCANDEDVSARAEYGVNFACGVSRGGIQGVQFHPEKSHHFGAQLLKNFAEL